MLLNKYAGLSLPLILPLTLTVTLLGAPWLERWGTGGGKGRGGEDPTQPGHEGPDLPQCPGLVGSPS